MYTRVMRPESHLPPQCRNEETKDRAERREQRNEWNVTVRMDVKWLTCQTHSPIIKLSGTLPYLNSQVLSGMHLKNWFTSCSPVIERGMWLMNCRLGWTAWGCQTRTSRTEVLISYLHPPKRLSGHRPTTLVRPAWYMCPNGIRCRGTP